MNPKECKDLKINYPAPMVFVSLCLAFQGFGFGISANRTGLIS